MCFADKLKKELDITSIVNCTDAPNAFPGHFEYLQLKLHDELKQEIVPVFETVFNFINETVQRGGKVFIHSERGQSRCAALAIAYIMHSQQLSFYEAYIFVKDRYAVLSFRFVSFRYLR